MTGRHHILPSRGWSIAAATAIVLTVVLASALLRGKTLRIAIHRNVEGVALKQIVAKFADERNFSIEVIELPYDELYEAELQDVQGDKDHGFDVIMLDDPWMPAMLGVEKTGDMTQLLPLDISADRISDFVESTLSVARNPIEGSGDSALYALPFVGNSQLFMRVKGNDSEYSNWDSVLDGNYVMRVGQGNQIVTDFIPMVWAKSAKGFRNDSVTFPPDALAAFELLPKLGNRGRQNLSIISQDDFDLAIQLQKKNASSSIIWSAWAMAMARLPESQRKEFFSNLEFSPMPGRQTLLGVWLLAIPRNSKHQDQARDFIEFATAKPQIIEAARAGNPPPLKSVLLFDLPQNEKDFGYAAFKEQFAIPFAAQLESLESAQPRPRTRHWKRIESAVGKCLSLLYESAISPEEARIGANKALDAIIREMDTADTGCRNPSGKPQ